MPSYWSWHDAVAPPASADPNRPVFPYSVIPGGVASAKELKATLQRDTLAAQHYSDFRVQSARVIRLAKERQAYISYRLGDRIYWTRKKVTLHAGETLLTDGAHLARTRCGNRISNVPADPVSPAEPAEKELDNPVLPRSPETTADFPLPGPFWPEGMTPFAPSPAGPLPPGAPGGGSPGTPFFPLTPCCGSIIEPPPPPVVPTPEPSSLVLLTVSLGCVFLLRLFRRS